MKAIAAMSLNRVIGNAGQIPWHLPEDFKWFKQMTTGKVVVMGRKTFESLGKPLPNRTNVVISRRGPIEGVQTVSDLAAFDPAAYAEEVFVIGGAEIYARLLPACSDLYLSVVQREVAGDVFFPKFEHEFERVGVVLKHAEFEVVHYRKLAAAPVSHPKDPLHGVKLETIVRTLQERYGWEEMGYRIPVRCFMVNPSVKSSLTFLRKTPWARKRVEDWFVFDLGEFRKL